MYNISKNRIAYEEPSICVICLENIDSDVEFSYIFNNFCNHLNSKYFHEHCLNRTILIESDERFEDIKNTKIKKKCCQFKCPLCRKHAILIYMR